MPYDLLIRRATLISGDGSDRFQADIAVTMGRIAATPTRLPATSAIRAT